MPVRLWKRRDMRPVPPPAFEWLVLNTEVTDYQLHVHVIDNISKPSTKRPTYACGHLIRNYSVPL
jgi:hypothetical protein